jgi:pimeloyl-ACP methyl ester carboxylesterase
MLRAGTIPGIPKYQKILHVGHSFGSALSYALAATQPSLSDGLVLTGWTHNQTLLGTTLAGMNSQLARLNAPKRFGKYPNSYMTWSDQGPNQYAFFAPGHYDPDMLPYAEAHKQPYTSGELLTLPAIPESAPEFTGPVLLLVGSESLSHPTPLLIPSYPHFIPPSITLHPIGQDSPYCGGDCYATGDPAIPSIAAGGAPAFPKAKTFTAYIQPNTGHALNWHTNSTQAFRVIGAWFRVNSLDGTGSNGF